MTVDIRKRNYPENCWWVAARVEDVTRTPIKRWLLDTPVTLFRAEDGSPVALDNRCPHRWAPLSAGYLEGDNIVCPYHGARFGKDGQCKKYPFQDKVPDNMSVRSFPVVDCGRFVWIWMGDPERATQADAPPAFEWDNNAEWFYTTGQFEFDANYFLLHENVLDLTHFNYTHAKTFQITNWDPKPEFMIDGMRAGFEATLYPEDFTKEELVTLGMDHPHTIKSISDGWFETPAYHVSKTSVIRKPGPDVPEEVYTNVVHMVTPASPTKTHYWWLIGTDYPLSDEMKAGYSGLIDTAYREDKVMLQSIQEILNNDVRGTDYPEFNLSGDGAGMLARRALAKWLEADKSPVG